MLYAACAHSCMLEATPSPSTISFMILICFSMFLSFYTHTPIEKCRLLFCLTFSLFLFWFLLSALLTCFVSFFPFCFLSAIQYLQMKWPLLDVQPGGLQSRQALKDARSPSPAHIVVSNTPLGTFTFSPALLPLFMTERQSFRLPSSILKTSSVLRVYLFTVKGCYRWIYP